MIKFLFAAILYKLAPIRTGTLALNTFINKAHTKNMGVPPHVLYLIAKEAYNTTRNAMWVERRLSSKRKPGFVDEVAAYTNQLEYYANAVIEILTCRIDDETARLRYPKIQEILTKTPWIPGFSS